jgi:predicted phosphate transport protein (TIGR00153 family)
MRDYLAGHLDKFDERRKEVSAIERKADDDLKVVKYKLYAFMLIPDTRGDVFKLMDDLDDVIDYTKRVLLELSMEQPCFPDLIKEDLSLMCEDSVRAVDALMLAVRALFSQTKMVEDHVNKVVFYEKEVDRIEEQVIRRIYASSEVSELARKEQIRRFCERIASLSDISEDISKNLLIYTVKRMV